MCKGPAVGRSWVIWGRVVTAQSQGPTGAITAGSGDQPDPSSIPAPVLVLLQKASRKGTLSASIFSSAKWGYREPDLLGPSRGFQVSPCGPPDPDKGQDPEGCRSFLSSLPVSPSPPCKVTPVLERDALSRLRVPCRPHSPSVGCAPPDRHPCSPGVLAGTGLSRRLCASLDS